jgi:hypothetical protein
MGSVGTENQRGCAGAARPRAEAETDGDIKHGHASDNPRRDGLRHSDVGGRGGDRGRPQSTRRWEMFL